jgi:mannosyltransferase
MNTRARFHLALAALVVVGCGLRLVRLSNHSLWFDETMSVYLARSPDLVAELARDRHPPLYFALLRGWIACFGDGPTALRSLSAVIGCAALAGMAVLARRLLAPRAAVCAVALAAFSPFSIWYAQEVRGYVLIEACSVLALLAAQRVLASSGRSTLHIAAVALASAIAFGTHYLGALVAVALVAFAAIERARGRASKRDTARVALAAGVGVLVWVPWLVRMLPRQTETAWSALEMTSARDVAELPVRLFLVDVDVLPPGWRFLGWGAGILILLAAALCVREATRGTPSALAILGAWVVPIALAYGASALVGPAFAPRYLMAIEPYAVLAVGLGLGALRPRWLGAGALGSIVLGCATIALLHKLENRKEDFRRACALAAQTWKPGDVVVCVTGTEPGFSDAPLVYYLRERPEMLASVVGERELLERRTRLPPGSIVHVVFRDAWYAHSSLGGLMEVGSVEFDAVTGERVRYLRIKTRGG